MLQTARGILENPEKSIENSKLAPGFKERKGSDWYGEEKLKLDEAESLSEKARTLKKTEWLPILRNLST